MPSFSNMRSAMACIPASPGCDATPASSTVDCEPSLYVIVLPTALLFSSVYRSEKSINMHPVSSHACFMASSFSSLEYHAAAQTMYASGASA